jgi:COMPASS component SWD3
MKAGEYPVTCIRWKPHNEPKPKNILVSVAADGQIIQWHTSSGKQLHAIQEDHPIMCMDYIRTGNLFATAGNDMQVRLYDDDTKTVLRTMKPSQLDQPGHSNRIFALNFHRENTNLLASGGWDNTVQFYDVRQGTIVNSLYGPHVCGDALDMKGDYLLTGSWALENQIQIWDLRNYKLVETINLCSKEKSHTSYIYAAQFNKTWKNNIFAIGGSNSNCLKIYDNSTEEKFPLASTNFMSKACYSIDFNNSGNMFAYAGGDGVVKILSIKNNSTSYE